MGHVVGFFRSMLSLYLVPRLDLQSTQGQKAVNMPRGILAT